MTTRRASSWLLSLRVASTRAARIAAPLALALAVAGCSGGEGTDDRGVPPADQAAGDSGATDGTGQLPAWPQGKYISLDEVHQRVTAGDSEMLLVNVSDVEFYGLGHIEGSLKIPWDEIGERLAEVPADRHVVLYCRRGVRSASAYSTLQGEGYALLWVMDGGLEQWIARGYPTVP